MLAKQSCPIPEAHPVAEAPAVSDGEDAGRSTPVEREVPDTRVDTPPEGPKAPVELVRKPPIDLDTPSVPPAQPTQSIVDLETPVEPQEPEPVDARLGNRYKSFLSFSLLYCRGIQP